MKNKKFFFKFKYTYLFKKDTFTIKLTSKAESLYNKLRFRFPKDENFHTFLRNNDELTYDDYLELITIYLSFRLIPDKYLTAYKNL
jgi:transposase